MRAEAGTRHFYLHFIWIFVNYMCVHGERIYTFVCGAATALDLNFIYIYTYLPTYKFVYTYLCASAMCQKDLRTDMMLVG